MFVYLTHLICFLLLILVAVFAFSPRLRPNGVDLTAAALSLIGIAYTVALAVTRLVVIAAVCVTLSSCANMSPQQQALLGSAENIASIAATAAATYYGGPAAGQLASAGLSALGTVLQGYVGTTAPKDIVKAAPGIVGVGDAILNFLPSTGVISQSTVDTIHRAAAIASAFKSKDVTPVK